MQKSKTKLFLVALLLLSLMVQMTPPAVFAVDIKGDQSSIMKIISPPEDTHTYNFYVDGVLDQTQIVKDGDYLLQPEAPEKADHKFIGWYVDDNPNPIDFSQAVTVTSTKEFDAVAKFEKVYYVFFMDGVGDDARVFKTKEGTSGTSVSTTDVILPLGSTQAVTGWYNNKELTGEPVGSSYTIGNANQTLWPKIEDGHYLYFVSGENGTYIEPQFVSPTGTTQAPPPPTRPGYTFKHWSETQGGAAYTFGQPLAANLTLYAVWTAKSNTNYTVVFWKQSVNDNKNATNDEKTYDFAESEVRMAASGATVSPTTADGNKNYQGFHYNAAKSVAVKVEGDGTTILNVYYDRNLLTIDFYKRSWGSWTIDQTMTGLYGQTLAQNGYTWPSEYRWINSNGSNTLTFLDSFIFDNLPDYGTPTHIKVYRQNPSGNAQIIHYKEALDGTWVEANTTQTNGGTFNFSNKYTGFTVAYYRADNGSWKTTKPGSSASYSSKLEVRHTRNSYNLTFYNYNAVAKTEVLKFEAPLSGQSGYVPSKPAGLPDEYVFKGWYKDNACSEPFNFATEMPSNNLMIYAKWAPPVVAGTIYLNTEGTGIPVEKTLTYGQSIDPDDMPTVKDHQGNILSQGDDNYIVTVPENHEWIGWSTKDGDDYITFNFDTLILSNIVLYPYYVDNSQLTVTYNTVEGDGSSGNPPIDGNKYAKGSYAEVMSPTGLTPPTDKVFLGWKITKVNGTTVDNGTIYQPVSKILITGHMTLTAQWGPVKGETFVTYKPGTNGIGDDYTISQLLINERITLLTPEECTITPKLGYKFTGWLNATDNEIYQPGTELMVDDDSQGEKNILTAQWAPILTVTSGTNSWTYDGDSHTYQQYTLVYGVATITGDEGQTSFTLPDNKTVTITPTGAGLDGVKTVSDNSPNNNTFTVEVDASVPQGDHVFGSLTITALTDKVTVTITENSGTELYDGTEKTVTGYTVTSISNPLYTENDFSFSGDASVSGKNAGTYNMELKPEDFTNNSANFTNVEFAIVDGTLEIAKRQVTLTSATDSKVYDGNPLTNGEVTVSGDGFAAGEGASYNVTGSQTVVGTSDNTFTYKLNSGTLAANYDIEKVLGELEVTALTDKVTVTITENSGDYTYDGAVKTVTGYTVTSISNPLYTENDFSFNGTASVSGKNAGTYNMELKPEDFTNNNTNFTNVEFVIVDGTLEIAKRQVTLTSATDSKVYDGTALKNDTVTVTGDGWATGEGVTYDVTGSQTDVGTSDNSFTFEFLHGTLLINYDITIVEGKLTVTALEDEVVVTITEKSGTELYDGTEKKVTGYTVAISNPLYTEADFSFSGDASVSGTNAGTYNMALTAADFTNNSANFTNVEFVIVDGTLEITKRQVTLTSATDSKVYDGNPLTNGEV
ncbi:MAG: InlB B-repeat-containing protein, partial [Saccharofermentanales bacterium]